MTSFLLPSEQARATRQAAAQRRARQAPAPPPRATPPAFALGTGYEDEAPNAVWWEPELPPPPPPRRYFEEPLDDAPNRYEEPPPLPPPPEPEDLTPNRPEYVAPTGRDAPAYTPPRSLAEVRRTMPDPYSDEALRTPAMPPPQSYYRRDVAAERLAGAEGTRASLFQLADVGAAARQYAIAPLQGRHPAAITDPWSVRGIDTPGIRSLPDRGPRFGPLHITPRTVAGFGLEAAADPTTYLPMPVVDDAFRIAGRAGGRAVGAAAAPVRRGYRALDEQAASSAMRRAAPEAFERGRGTLTPEGELRPFAIRAEDAIPRQTYIAPDRTLSAGLAGGADVRPLTKRQLDALQRKALAGTLTDADRARLMEELGRTIGATTPEQQLADAPWNRPPDDVPLAPEGERLVAGVRDRLRTIEQAGNVERSLADARRTSASGDDPFARFDRPDEPPPPAPIAQDARQAIQERAGAVARGETAPGAARPPTREQIDQAIIDLREAQDRVQARPENTPQEQQGGLFDRDKYRAGFKQAKGQNALPGFPFGGSGGGAIDLSPGELASRIPREQWVPPSQITTRPDLFQARDVAAGQATDPRRVAQIVDNFNAERFEPITVARAPEGELVVISGHHRLEAARQLNLPEIPVRIVAGDISSPEGRALLQNESALSNFLAAPNNVREQYNAFRTLEANGQSVEQIAPQVRQSAEKVERVLDIGRAGPVVLERVVQTPQTADIAAAVGRAVRRFGISQDDAFGLFDAFVRRGRGESLPSYGAVWTQLEKLAPVLQTPQLPGFDVMDLGATRTPLYEAIRDTVRLQDELVRTQARVSRDVRGAQGIAERTGVDASAVVDAGNAELEAIRGRLQAVEAEVVERIRQAQPPPAVAETVADIPEIFPTQEGPGLFDAPPQTSAQNANQWIETGGRPPDAAAQIAAIRAGGAINEELAGQLRARQAAKRDTYLISDLEPSGVADLATRGALRRRIADQLYGTGAARQERRVDIVLGVSASGKSKLFADPLAAQHGALVVDADEAKRLLPEYEGGNAAGAVHEESSRIADAVLVRAAERGDNLVLPYVGKNPQRIQGVLDELGGLGYQAHVHYMDLDVGEAARRAWARYLEGGQFVDPDYVRGLGSAPANTYNVVKRHPAVATFESFNNDVPFGTPPRQLDAGTNQAAGRPGQAGPGGLPGAGRAALPQGAAGAPRAAGQATPPLGPKPTIGTPAATPAIPSTAPPAGPPPGQSPPRPPGGGPPAPPGGGAQPALPGMPPLKRGGAPAYFQDLLLDLAELATGGLKAGFDFSGFRQLGPSVPAHPVRTLKAARRELHAIFSEGEYLKNEARIDAKPHAQLRTAVDPNWKRTMDPGALGTPQVRTVLMKAANRLGYRGFNRGFVTLLNTFSDETFEALLKADGRPMLQIPLDEVKAMSNAANIAVGRGPLPSGFTNSVGGARLAWAPALISSRISLPFLLGSKSPQVRKEAARQIAAFTVANSAILATGSALGLWEVELDPRSADFGQGRVGNQRIDFWAGFRPLANLAARMYTGESKSTKSGEVYKMDRRQIAANFGRSKLAPGLSTAINLWMEENAIGEEFGWRDVPKDLFLPLFIDDLYEAFTNGASLGEIAVNGETAQRVGIGALAGIGLGVTTHTPDAEQRAAAGEYGQLKPEQQLEAFRAEGWRALQQDPKAPPELADYGSYYEWVDAERPKRLEAAQAEARERGLHKTTGELIAAVESSIDKDPVSKAFAKVRRVLEDEWIGKNPQLALDLYDRYQEADAEEKREHPEWNINAEQRQLAHEALEAQELRRKEAVPPKLNRSFSVDRDGDGRIAAIRASDGSRRRVRRDADGRMIGVDEEQLEGVGA